MNLRQITIKDQLELKKVYFDSIQSLDERIYNNFFFTYNFPFIFKK